MPLNVNDYEPLAKEMMHPSARAYFFAGPGDELTLRREREAFDPLRLVPRVLRGVDHADTSTIVLGTPIRVPIMVAPTGVQGLAHPEGECATALAAGEAGTLMTVSTVSPRRLGDVSVGPRAHCGSCSTSTSAPATSRRRLCAGRRTPGTGPSC